MIRWLLGGNPGASGSLVWTGSDAAVAVAAVLALGALVLALRGRRSLTSAVFEGLCWALALAGVVVALARPVWLEEEGRTEPGRVAVLVDGSSSMGVREGSQTRGEEALEILDRLGSRDVEVFHFGDQLASGRPGGFELPGTDFESALAALDDRYAGEQLAGVVLISDGLDRGLLRRRFLKDENPVPPNVPGPLTVFQVGRAGAVKDLSVRFVDAGGYAYVHTPFRIRADLLGLGFEGQEVKADLLVDGATVRSKRVTLDDEGRGEVVFEVTADRAGRFTYLVQVPDYEDDAVAANNALPVVVRVVRDRIRVLQVAGSPSWDVKFLRRFLKGDPSVDLVSFFILRTQRDLSRGWDEKELSLIRFPYEQLFDEDLKTFDLVIFQNFDHKPYFATKSSQLLQSLHDYVAKDGHAMVMIGGDRSFSLGAYGTTPINDILPVSVAKTGVTPDPESFQPKLTEAGKRHPVSRLVSDLTENELWWSRLQPMDGTNTGVLARPSSTVLLTHPTLLTERGTPLPVLSVREAGAGRTMAFTADSSWRWSLSEAAQGRGNQAYLRFWKGAIRWLVRDPTTARVTVDTSRENYGLGDEVRVVVRARDADFAPMVGGTVSVVVRSGAERWTLEGVTGDDGEAVLAFPTERRGAHRVDVTVTEEGHRPEEASTVFAVTSRDPELDEVAPDADFLQWLARRTDGAYYAAGERGTVQRDPSAGRTLWDRRELPVWRSPLVALWVGLFAGIAWIIRRRSGLK